MSSGPSGPGPEEGGVWGSSGTGAAVVDVVLAGSAVVVVVGCRRRRVVEVVDPWSQAVVVVVDPESSVVVVVPGPTAAEVSGPLVVGGWPAGPEVAVGAGPF
jgi:hypothetical protein